MAEEWYVRDATGTVRGPLQEREVSTELLGGRIGDDQEVRQGADGPWCGAARARNVFRQLAEVGWYIRTNGEVFGPFTNAKLLQLHRENEMDATSEIRQGTSNAWRSASAVLSLWQQQKAPKSATNGESSAPTDEEDESTSGGKWSIEPLRHIVVDLEVPYAGTAKKCSPLEHLLLNESDDDSLGDRLLLTRTNGQRVGFLGIENSRQLLANAERGLSHVTLLHSAPSTASVQVAIVLCPPGTTSAACKQYIDEQFRPTVTQSSESSSN